MMILTVRDLCQLSNFISLELHFAEGARYIIVHLHELFVFVPASSVTHVFVSLGRSLEIK